MQNFEKSILLNSEKKVSFSEILFLYLSYLPLFIVSVSLALTVAFIYLRYQTPEFKTSTSIVVKADDKSSGSIRGAAAGGDLIDAAMFGGAKRINLENEIELLRSTSLLERVVQKNRYNIQYYVVGRVVTTEIFELEFPAKVNILALPDSTRTINFGIKNLNSVGGVIYNKKTKVEKKFLWNEILNYFNLKVQFIPNNSSFDSLELYECTWKPVSSASSEIARNLTVSSLNAKATIIKFSLVTTNAKRGAEILDALVTEYKASNVQDKNTIANNTVDFINGRLEIIAKDLGDVETNAMELEIANPTFYQPAITSLKGNELLKNS